MFQEQKFHLNKEQAQFLDRYREYGFQDKNQLVMAALQRLQLELESQKLPKSTLEKSPTADLRELSGMLYQADRKTVSLEEMDQAIAKGAGESL